MSGINRSALEIIGNTPLVELCNIEKKYHLQARILAKLEFFNLAGSAKDRIAKEMVEDAERRGILKQGATLIEPTSGNTGIGLAAVAAVKGYRAIFVMPETMSAERINILRAYGAEIVLTEGIKGMAGSIEKAESLAREIPNSFIPAQFDNPANAIAHEKTTGPEIWKDTEGKVDAFVAVEPASSHCCQKGESGPHKIQGIGANFIPKVLDKNVYDKVLAISDEDALKWAKEVGRTEWIAITPLNCFNRK